MADTVRALIIVESGVALIFMSVQAYIVFRVWRQGPTNGELGQLCRFCALFLTTVGLTISVTEHIGEELTWRAFLLSVSNALVIASYLLGSKRR